MRGFRELNDLLDGAILIDRAVVITCGESEGCPHIIVGRELDLIAKESGCIRVFELATQFLKYND
jgi:hypothetical protein